MTQREDTMNEIAARLRLLYCNSNDINAAADEIERLEKVIAEQVEIIANQESTIYHMAGEISELHSNNH